MLNPSSNPALENPFHGINPEPFIEFFRNEDNYETVLNLLMRFEKALDVPVAPLQPQPMQEEYWKLMQFLEDRKLVGAYLEYRKTVNYQEA